MFDGQTDPSASTALEHAHSNTASRRAHLARDLASALEFRVRLVRTEEQLRQAIVVRGQAYSRHFPTLREILSTPEADDRQPGTNILLAESKATGEPVGTIRIHSNLAQPTQLEKYLTLPERYRNRTLAHACRLAVVNGRRGHYVKMVLFKALYRYCAAMQLSAIIVGAAPPVDRDYVRLLFEDVFSPGELVQVPFSKGVPLRVLALEVDSAERRWREAGHPFYDFFFRAYTPDIEIFSSINGMWALPRQRRGDAAGLSALGGINIPIV